MTEQEEPTGMLTLRDQIEDAKQVWKSLSDKKAKQEAFDKIQALWVLLRAESGDFQCKPKKSF